MQQCRVHSGQWFTMANISIRNATQVGDAVGAASAKDACVAVLVADAVIEKALKAESEARPSTGRARERKPIAF